VTIATSVPTLPTQLAGINIETMGKGDYFTPSQVEHAYRVLDPKTDENLERYRRSELKSDPLTFMVPNLIKYIERVRIELGKPVVCRGEQGGIRILTDVEAVEYLNNQANAGLRKHKSKTTQMFTSIDTKELTEHEQRKLDTNQRKHAFILASHQGARTQVLRMGRKGLMLPDYSGK
jgi:hypothetical protein